MKDQHKQQKTKASSLLQKEEGIAEVNEQDLDRISGGLQINRYRNPDGTYQPVPPPFPAPPAYYVTKNGQIIDLSCF